VPAGPLEFLVPLPLGGELPVPLREYRLECRAIEPGIDSITRQGEPW
jgi:hypothetical protein